MKNYGSKKKNRNVKYVQRESKRSAERNKQDEYNRVMRDKNSTIEDVAKVMGIPLK